MNKPALFVPELKRPVQPGKLSLFGAAHFANFRYTPSTSQLSSAWPSRYRPRRRVPLRPGRYRTPSPKRAWKTY
jgi:hypothetical protein